MIDIDRLRAAAEKDKVALLVDGRQMTHTDPTTIIALCDELDARESQLLRMREVLDETRAEVARLRNHIRSAEVEFVTKTGALRTTIEQLDAEVARLRQELGRPLETERECARLRELLRQCWYWFDDHDDRMTSTELHKMLKEMVQP